MLPRNHPDRIQITFDDRRLVANAGLLLPATLARHLGLPELVRQRLDLGDAPGRANTSDKMMTLVASALAGGDCIDDADVLRTGGTACTLGGTVKAPSTLGTFLRSFRWGHVRQLDRVSRELLARAWQAGAGPGDGPLTIDLDSTICETYGLAKEGARHHGYTGKRGYHPLLAIAAGTGDVLMSRLREGRANTARGAAHFLRETVGRVRYAGANGRLTLRADSGFYTHGVVSVCRKMDVRFSITIRQHKSLHNLIEAIPEDAWTPIPYWMDGAADVAETTCTPFQAEADAAPVRLIVRRVKPTPGSQLALFAKYSYHGFITDRDGELLELEADHRRHAEIENAIRDLKYGVGLNHLPSGRFAANGAWLAVHLPQEVGGAAGGVGPALAQPGHQHVSGAGGDGQQRVVAALAGIAVVAGALLGQSVGLADGGVQVNGQGPVAGSRPGLPSPGQQLAAHPVELTDVAPPEAAQEGAQGGWRLDRAAQGAGRPPGAQHIGVVNAVAPSQRRRHQRHHLVARVRPPRGIAQVEALPDEFGQAEVPRQGGRKEQPGIGHQAAVVEGDLDPVGVVAWQHLLGAPFPGPFFCYKTIIPEAQEHLLAASGR